MERKIHFRQCHQCNQVTSDTKEITQCSQCQQRFLPIDYFSSTHNHAKDAQERALLQRNAPPKILGLVVEW